MHIRFLVDNNKRNIIFIVVILGRNVLYVLKSKSINDLGGSGIITKETAIDTSKMRRVGFLGDEVPYIGYHWNLRLRAK